MTTITEIRELIAKGETDCKTHIEFKTSQNSIPDAVYSSICAFLNTKGGHILLGVKDNGEICGINPAKSAQMKQDFISEMNSSQKINPPFVLNVEELEVDGKIVFHIYIPEGSSVSRCKNKIYIRNSEGDYDITHNHQEVANLYLQKESSYSENKIFPYVKLEHLRKDLIDRSRNLAVRLNPSHPWQEMDDMEMLRHASLYTMDQATGKEGFTLAAVLLLGTDELIASVVPGFRVDAIKRVKNTERYDDRLDIKTNLIESYDKLMQFIEKHLPDTFFLQDETERLNIRNIIFREVIANILVHKEYLKAEPTMLVIEKNRIYTENSNKPYINGIINLENAKTHPKNPNITKFFKQIGRVEELGSGIRKLIKLGKQYSGNEPVFKDENIFTFSMAMDPGYIPSESYVEPITNPIDFAKTFTASDQVNDQVDGHAQAPGSKGSAKNVASGKPGSDQVLDQVRDQVLTFCKEPKALKEILAKFKTKSRVKFKASIIDPLLEKGLLQQTEKKSNSSKQKYVTVSKIN
jgi:ATP-dependent DNA helicase RecG